MRFDIPYLLQRGLITMEAVQELKHFEVYTPGDRILASYAEPLVGAENTIVELEVLEQSDKGYLKVRRAGDSRGGYAQDSEAMPGPAHWVTDNGKDAAGHQVYNFLDVILLQRDERVFAVDVGSLSEEEVLKFFGLGTAKTDVPTTGIFTDLDVKLDKDATDSLMGLPTIE